MIATPAPVEDAAAHAWRPLLRIGARTARRNPWRSLLVIALIAVPVAAAIIVAAGQRTLAPTAEQQQAWYAIATVVFAIPAVLVIAVGLAVRSRPPAAAVPLS